MSSQPRPRVTVEEYLAQERRAETKSEFFDGQVFAMTGASRRHGLIAVNVVAALHPQLKGRDCEVFAADMRVGVPATTLYAYPDVVVVCGQPQFADAELDTLLNPTLIVEVLHDRTLSSLREYLLLAQDRVHVEHFARQDRDRWLLAETDDPGAVLTLASIGCQLSLADAYARVA